MADIPLSVKVTSLESFMYAMDVNGHGRRASRLAVEMGRRLNGGSRLNENDLSMLGDAIRLHDCYKAVMDPAIIHKPGKLTPEEYEYVKTHTRKGYEMTRHHYPAQICLTILYHHERWNGSGYPDGLAGLDIPLFARIAAIVDVWDSLVSDRSYRKKYSKDIAMGIMNEGYERDWFDPKLYTIFLDIRRERDLTHG